MWTLDSFTTQMTYLEDILDFLTDEPQSLDAAFLTGDKTTYAIAAIKQGIKQGKIMMIQKPDGKTKYKELFIISITWQIVEIII